MLGKAAAMIAVKDLDRARKFYEETLGLETDAEWGEGVTMRSGDTVFNVYRSEFAGTNKATALNFDVVELFERIGLRKVIDEFLGEPATVSIQKTTLRKADPGPAGGWHQDGSSAYDFKNLAYPVPLVQLRASFHLNDQSEPFKGN